MSTSEKAGSTWAPLRVGIFRALWLASLVSNIGAWMQPVGAQWLLVQQPHAPLLIALVQTADALPDVLFAYVGGVLADTFDRRLLLIVVQGCLFITGLALTLLTIAGQMPPALLLTLTFVLGAGSAFSVPAYQALLPDLIPRPQLPSASALGSISINLAAAVGPVLAGVLIAWAGVGAVFALNTVTFLVFGLVVAAWRPPAGTTARFPERFIAALRAGERYVRYAPVVRRILVRSALFLVPASALLALLPVVASQRLGLGANGYGLLLGALGVGAIAGALALPRLRATLSSNALLLAASLVHTAALVALVLVPDAAVILVVLVATGIAWIAVLSSMNAAMQLFLPTWVRARGLAAYQIVLFGAQAGGAVLWGVMVGPVGLVATFLLAAAVMAAGAATLRLWPLFDTSGIDRSLAVYWPEPHLVFEPDPQAGPVLVTTTYTFAPENEQPFLEAMSLVRGSRLRTGAVEWGLYRDGETAHRFVEFFVVPSWEEHLRQHHERQTDFDRQHEEQASTLSDPPPQTTHLLAADLPDE
ncbi:MAG TPA: MFS transporter [Ktedonobacterales bacterium]|nr:MFS transporter [Ktedonobacterales bacterium]